MTHRRKLLVALGAGVLTAPLASFAQQQGKVWRIGYLDPRTPSTSAGYFASFVRGMRELGYSEGRNMLIEQKFSEGNQERLQRLAAEFVNSNVDVIVTDSSLAVRAAMKATTTIPIVAAVIADPVSAGFAKSLARPGGNVTGFSNMSEELVAKRLEMLVTAVPAASRIAFLFNPLSESRVPDVQAAGKTSGRSIVLARASTPQEIDSAFAQMLRESVGALIITQDGFLSSQASRIAGLALRQRLPSIGGRREIAEAGILLSYGVDYVDMFRRAATYVDKILKGAKPGDLPIDQATKFELVVNMKTAKALGITIPQSILVRADRVIK